MASGYIRSGLHVWVRFLLPHTFLSYDVTTTHDVTSATGASAMPLTVHCRCLQDWRHGTLAIFVTGAGRRLVNLALHWHVLLLTRPGYDVAMLLLHEMLRTPATLLVIHFVGNK